jgi:hypothetical protein
MFSSSMWKHACWMFLYGFHLFCAHVNITLAVLICAGSTNCGYTTTLPEYSGAMNGLGSRRAYTIGNNLSPNHLWIVLCGHMSCLSARAICFCRAWSFVKSGQGNSMGGFFRSSTTISYVMRWSIFVCTIGDGLVR